MRKLVLALACIVFLSSGYTAKADESLWQLYKRDPEAWYKKVTCQDEEAKANGYYSECDRSYDDYANDRPSKKAVTSNNKKTTKTYKSKSDELNRGFVGGQDQLHVVGTPSNSNGYTAAGNCTGYELEGKGYVYDADELHVIGLPSDPETGYTKPGFYGNISE